MRKKDECLAHNSICDCLRDAEECVWESDCSGTEMIDLALNCYANQCTECMLYFPPGNSSDTPIPVPTRLACDNSTATRFCISAYSEAIMNIENTSVEDYDRQFCQAISFFGSCLLDHIHCNGQTMYNAMRTCTAKKCDDCAFFVSSSSGSSSSDSISASSLVVSSISLVIVALIVAIMVIVS